MKKVMIFGAFDPIGKRHHELFRAAVDHGDGVMAVLMRDEEVVDPQTELTESETDRLVALMSIDIVDDVILAHGGYTDVVRTHSPDIILIGAHQKDIAEELYDIVDDLEACNCVIVYT